MPKSLEDGHIKFTILTTEPSDPTNPTPTELNAGIQAACSILNSDFAWTATDSDKNAEKALCQENNTNSLGASNYSAGITVFRIFDADNPGQADVSDTTYAAAKTKGTELWCYARRTGATAMTAWAAGDEIYLGGHVVTDSPQVIQGGFIKSRIPMEMQDAYPDITVAS